MSSSREILSAARLQLAGPFDGEDALLRLLLPTLDILDILPPTLRGHPSSHTLHASDDELRQDLRVAYRSRAWLQDVQQAVLGHIALDWAPRLAQDGLWNPILVAWFTPEIDPPKSEQSRYGLVSLAQPQEEEDHLSSRNVSASLVTSSGLQAFLFSLSRLTVKADEGSSSIPPSLISTVETLISSFCNPSFSLLKRLLLTVTSEMNAARRKLTWEESVQAVVSLPSRAANALKGDVPPEATIPEYFANISVQLAEEVASLAQDLPSSSLERLNLLSVLLAKLLRSGQVNANFWKAVIPSAIRHSKQDCSSLLWSTSYVQCWKHLTSSMDASDQTAFHLSLLTWLDQDAESGGLRGLVASNERGRPALLGKRFLGVETSRIVGVRVRIIALFLGLLPRDSERKNGPWPEDLDTNEDEENSDESYAERIRSYMFDGRQRYSPTMARTFAALLRELDPSATVDALLEAIDLWGTSDRVKRATVDQEEYLAAHIIVLLAQSSQSAGTGSINIGQAVTRRQEFVEGVASHLGHLDPHVRLIGMLLAEIASEVAHSVSIPGDGSGKKLEFGRGSWDGVGGGKEEARVLRSLFHSWKVLTSNETDAKRETALESLGLAKNRLAMVETPARAPGYPNKRREPPQSRRLPTQRPAKASAVGQKNHSVLIAEVDGSDNDELPGQGRAPVESDSEVSSSEESDSSAESGGDDVHNGFAETDMPLDPSAFMKQSRGKTSEEDELFELDTRKRRRPPVYIWELTSMLREKDRDAIRIGLKNAEALILRKAGWGGEVDENSVDLAFVLVGLQNNYRIKRFDERRTKALHALVVASPRLTAGAIIEQFFTDSWSIVQRFAILNALAAASRELAGMSPLLPSAQEAKRISSKRQSQSQAQEVTTLAESLSNVAISRAKQEGEERVPEIKRENAVKITSQRGPKAVVSTRAGIQELDTFPSSNIRSTATSTLQSSSPFRSLPGTLTRPKEKYVEIASSVFLFPLMNRLTAHIKEVSSRSSRLVSLGGPAGGNGLGSGINVGLGSLFDPSILAALLDTIAVLSDTARNSLDFSHVLAPEILELNLLVLTRALPLSLAGSDHFGRKTSDPTSLGRGGGGGGGGGGASAGGREWDDLQVVYEISGACLSLILIVLDTAFSKDQGSTLLTLHAPLLEEIASFAGQIFNEVEQRGISNHVGGNGASARASARASGSGNGGVNRSIARAARCSAAVVLRIEEMRSLWRHERMGN